MPLKVKIDRQFNIYLRNKTLKSPVNIQIKTIPANILKVNGSKGLVGEKLSDIKLPLNIDLMRSLIKNIRLLNDTDPKIKEQIDLLQGLHILADQYKIFDAIPEDLKHRKVEIIKRTFDTAKWVFFNATSNIDSKAHNYGSELPDIYAETSEDLILLKSTLNKVIENIKKEQVK